MTCIWHANFLMSILFRVRFLQKNPLRKHSKEARCPQDIFELFCCNTKSKNVVNHSFYYLGYGRRPTKQKMGYAAVVICAHQCYYWLSTKSDCHLAQQRFYISVTEQLLSALIWGYHYLKNCHAISLLRNIALIWDVHPLLLDCRIHLYAQNSRKL